MAAFINLGGPGGASVPDTPENREKSQLLKDMQKAEADKDNAGLASKLTNLSDGGGSSQPFALKQTKTQNIGGTVTLDRVYGVSEPGGIHRILGAANPSAGTTTNLFTVLAAHTARVSVLWACNRRLIKSKVRLGFDVGGDGANAPGNSDWLYYDLELPGNSTLVLDAATGLWFGALDDIVVRTDIGGVNFGASGSLYA